MIRRFRRFRRFGMTWFLVLPIFLGSCVPWTMRPIEEEKEAKIKESALNDPIAYVDSIWTTKLIPKIIGTAIDARILLDGLASSFEDTAVRYGQKTANGPVYFIVKGEGVITAVDTRSRSGLALVDIAPFDQQPDLSIQIGPVLRGTSLRDAGGVIPFSDFINQLQFADVGNELNRRVLKTVLASLNRDKLKGSKVSFMGTLAAEKGVHPPLRELIPVQLTMKERR